MLTYLTHYLNRKDNKRVSVIKFISRTSKFNILAAKKLNANKNFKFRDNEIYINDHLSPGNRALFAHATERKKTLGYKFLWTKNGICFLRKNEKSEIFPIHSQEDLDRLAFA